MYDATPNPNSRSRTIVIGGGLAGLSAAVRLAGQGTSPAHELTVIEATRSGGGRSRSFADPITGREIDNGQHLMMGCYFETLAFLRAIGVPSSAIAFQHNLAARMLMPGGQQVDLRCPSLPAPLHLAAGLLGMRGVGLIHRLAALRAGLLLNAEVARPDDNETCDAWLRRMGQTQRMRACFWEPLIWGVLNEDPLVASAAMLLAVIERAFMGTRDASRFGIPKLPLSRLYVEPAIDHLRNHGAELKLGASVRSIIVEKGRACGVELRSGEVLRAERIISAVPPHALVAMLPEVAREHLVFRDVARLEYSPIVNLWATLDRPLFRDRAFVGLVDSPLHWIFDRDAVEDVQSAHGRLISVTISGARAFVRDDGQTLQQLLASELARFFPSCPVKILAFRAVKEKRATIGHAAGTYTARPEARSPIPGLTLAGDWVRTGLPATIESAVQSGHTAAKIALETPVVGVVR